jgi:cytochrome bd ubiquinol oxidase subunit II
MITYMMTAKPTASPSKIGRSAAMVAHPEIARRWFSWPNIAFLWPVPIVTGLVAFGIWRSLFGSCEAPPFLLSIALFLLGFFGLGISLWPYAVPYSAVLWRKRH